MISGKKAAPRAIFSSSVSSRHPPLPQHRLWVCCASPCCSPSPPECQMTLFIYFIVFLHLIYSMEGAGEAVQASPSDPPGKSPPSPGVPPSPDPPISSHPSWMVLLPQDHLPPAPCSEQTSTWAPIFMLLWKKYIILLLFN